MRGKAHAAYGTKKKNLFNRVEQETSIEIHAECKTAKKYISMTQLAKLTH